MILGQDNVPNSTENYDCQRSMESKILVDLHFTHDKWGKKNCTKHI
jgi:hypothetical protein